MQVGRGVGGGELWDMRQRAPVDADPIILRQGGGVALMGLPCGSTDV